MLRIIPFGLGSQMATLKDFAERAGLSPKRFNEIETGTGHPVDMVEIEAIAKALDMPAWRLIQIVEESEDPER